MLAPRSHSTFKGRVHDAFFRSIHRRHLIYNASWEDPRVDRALLGLDRKSKVVVLTGGGCNTLDYLLDNPSEVHAVDVNPTQNALLHLKMALLQTGQFEDLYEMFGQARIGPPRECSTACATGFPSSLIDSGARRRATSSPPGFAALSTTAEPPARRRGFSEASSSAPERASATRCSSSSRTRHP